MKTSLDTACDTVTATALGANVITAASMNADASSEIMTAMKASTGWTAGGTLQLDEAIKVMLAAIAGDMADKGGGGYKYLDAEDGSTEIFSFTTSITTPYTDTTVP
jgi:hypothetical protein